MRKRKRQKKRPSAETIIALVIQAIIAIASIITAIKS
jgi:hypothetical protein